MYKSKNCIKCNNKFFPNSPKQKYCKSCLTYICKVCKKSFIIKDPQQIPNFCSQKCYFENRWEKSRKIKIKCLYCKKDILCFISQKRKFCNKKCYIQWKKFHKVKSPHWKGGKIKYGSNSQYWAIYQPYHPFTDSKGYVFEHRLVMEKHLKRFLKPEEIIHHINKNPQDNRIENLQLMTKSEHDKFETMTRWKNNHIKPFHLFK